MAPNKINLKSSISAINAKSSAGKKKVLPKLKVILANPYKPKFDTLIDDDLSQFKKLISSEIKSSGMSVRMFARENNIQLGLGCCLQAIGNTQVSCVIISQSIKPKFIIDQIGCFARQRNGSIPVFVVADLENISAELFGVKSQVVCFPLHLEGNIGKWIVERTLKSEKIPRDDAVELKTPPAIDKKAHKNVDFKTLYLPKPSNGTRSFVPNYVVESKPLPKEESKDWTGDYISLSNATEIEDEPMDMDEIDEEFNRKQDKALEKLQKIASKLKTVETKPKTVNLAESCIEKSEPPAKKQMFSTESEEWENDTYVSLEVHKIQPNPNRKPKNKRKKKNKKNEINKK